MPIITNPSDYARAPAACVSFSRLKLFEYDEERFYRQFVLGEEAPEEKDSHALVYGSAAHCYLLEGPTAFEQGFAVRPNTYVSEKGEEKPWNGNAKVCQAWAADAIASGKQVLTPKDHADVLAMADALAKNETAASLLADGRPELAIRLPGSPLGRQGRLDWINHSQSAILDIKTIDDANDRKRTMVDRLYYRQLAFYGDLARGEFLRDYRCAIVWLEKSWPFRCLVEWMPLDLIDIGRRQNEASLARLSERITSGGWRIAPVAAEIPVPLELVEIEPSTPVGPPA